MSIINHQVLDLDNKKHFLNNVFTFIRNHSFIHWTHWYWRLLIPQKHIFIELTKILINTVDSFRIWCNLFSCTTFFQFETYSITWSQIWRRGNAELSKILTLEILLWHQQICDMQQYHVEMHFILFQLTVFTQTVCWVYHSNDSIILHNTLLYSFSFVQRFYKFMPSLELSPHLDSQTFFIKVVYILYNQLKCVFLISKVEFI